SSAALASPDLVSQIARELGSQSVVVVLDAKRRLLGRYEVYTHNGRKATGKTPAEMASRFEQLGAGEVVINSIDNDGVMKGYDEPLARSVREATSLPMTVLGGGRTM